MPPGHTDPRSIRCLVLPDQPPALPLPRPVSVGGRARSARGRPKSAIPASMLFEDEMSTRHSSMLSSNTPSTGYCLCEAVSTQLRANIAALQSDVLALRSDLDLLKQSVAGGKAPAEASEALHSVVRSEVSAMARQLSASLDRRVLGVQQMDAKLRELEGFMHSAEKDNLASHRGSKDWQGRADGRFAELSAALDSAVAGAREELQRACAEFDGRLTAMCKHHEDRRNVLEGSLSKELQDVARKQTLHSNEFHDYRHNVAQQLQGVRHDIQKGEENCARFMDECRADTAARIEEHQARVQGHLEEHLGVADARIDAAAAATKQYADGQDAALGARIDAAEAVAQEHRAEFQAGLQEATERLEAAATMGADQAQQRMEEGLRRSVGKASRSLASKVGSAAEDVARTKERDAEWLEAELYGLVAKESVEMEMRTLIDRAVARLKVVSDDLASRSVSFEDRVDAAEKRLKGCSADLARRLAAIEARTQASPEDTHMLLGIDRTFLQGAGAKDQLQCRGVEDPTQEEPSSGGRRRRHTG